MADQPMSKTEARAFIRRARAGLRWMEEALAQGDADELNEACGEAVGSIIAVQDALTSEHEAGIRGMDWEDSQ